MYPQSLWHMNPQFHPVTHCSFDRKTLICASTPYDKQPNLVNIFRRSISYEYNVVQSVSSWNIKSMAMLYPDMSM
jgi:hypothetical protein